MEVNGKPPAPAALIPGKNPPIPTEYEAEWASEQV
jgi:hypothetical protein